MTRRPALAVLSTLVVASLTASCGPPFDLKQTLQVTDVSSGYFDAGVQAGKNKLVPSVTFKLKKNADVKLSSVSLNLTYSVVGSQDHADDVFVQNVPFEGPETAPIVVRTQWGYTADPPQTRAQMLENSHFNDVEVKIF